MLVGGGDVDPSRYGQTPDDHVYGVETDRDAFEVDLLLAADRMHIPTLCICRGMQVMNVAFGGTLLQHLPALEGLVEHGVPMDDVQTMHDVIPVPRTRLSAVTKSVTLTCSSHHHQGVDRVGGGLSVTGRSSDGLVEAIERIVVDDQDEFATWMLGVQWHPEDTSAGDAAQQALFDALALLARLRGTRARPGELTGRSRPYQIVDHDPAWAERYRREAARIEQALPPTLVVAVEHIGSTSVPGLAAKPVIDIQLALSSLVPREAYLGPLEALGYRHVLDPWADEHEFFSLDSPDGGADRAVNLHAVLAGSDWDERHLAFRNYLRTHPETAAGYETLKRTLAAEHPGDVHTYTREKTHFIRAIEGQATGGGRESVRG